MIALKAHTVLHNSDKQLFSSLIAWLHQETMGTLLSMREGVNIHGSAASISSKYMTISTVESLGRFGLKQMSLELNRKSLISSAYNAEKGDGIKLIGTCSSLREERNGSFECIRG